MKAQLAGKEPVQIGPGTEPPETKPNGDDYLKRREGMAGPRYLNLSRTNVTAVGFQYLSEHSDGLWYLDLSDCPEVSDACLAIIATFPALRELRLKGTKVSNEGLRHLHGCKTLERLDLRQVAGITTAGVAELRKFLPQCLAYRKTLDPDVKRRKGNRRKDK
jgi:hypothetical protein